MIVVLSLAWSILMGINAIVYAWAGNTHETLFSLSCGVVSFVGYEINKNRHM